MAGIPSPVVQIHDPFFQKKKVTVWVKRDDLIHPLIMGNKWRKLKYNLLHARENGFEGIITMGGAFSNHIAATASACRENGLKSIGLIRGDELNETSNKTLRQAVSHGMELRFVSRATYRNTKLNFEEYVSGCPAYFGIPEGGTNNFAIKGCAEIVQELEIPYHYLITPVGTGGTMAGLLKGLRGEKKLLGISVLKGEFVKNDFAQLIQENKIPYKNYQLFTNFHFGGYGKVNPELIELINRTKSDFDLSLDPIYTGKMYFGIKALIEKDLFAPGSDIVILHTGGLQGIDGFNEKHQKKILL